MVRKSSLGKDCSSSCLPAIATRLLSTNAMDIGGVPIQNSLTLIPTDAANHMDWRTITFNGSPADFLNNVRNVATEEPWLDEASVRHVTIAGLPAIVYNRYHAPQYQDYIIGLRSNLLLLINSDARRPEQTAVVEQLIVVGQPADPRPIAQQIAYIHDPERSICCSTGRQINPGRSWLAPVGSLAWSPDGVWLAFSAGLENSHIYTVRADGSGEHQGTHGRDYERIYIFAIGRALLHPSRFERRKQRVPDCGAYQSGYRRNR